MRKSQSANRSRRRANRRRSDDPKGKPILHIHIVLGTRHGSAKAGHLGEGHVRPTLEVIITESPAHLRKVKDDETVALIRPAA